MEAGTPERLALDARSVAELTLKRRVDDGHLRRSPPKRGTLNNDAGRERLGVVDHLDKGISFPLSVSRSLSPMVATVLSVGQRREANACDAAEAHGEVHAAQAHLVDQDREERVRVGGEAVLPLLRESPLGAPENARSRWSQSTALW